MSSISSFLNELGGWRALIMMVGVINFASLKPVLDWFKTRTRPKLVSLEATANYDIYDFNVSDTFAAVSYEISKLLLRDPEAWKTVSIIKEVQLRRHGPDVRIFQGGFLKTSGVVINMSLQETVEKVNNNSYKSSKWTMYISAEGYDAIDAFTKACALRYKDALEEEKALQVQSLYTVSSVEKDLGVFSVTPFKSTKTFDNLFFPHREAIMKDLDRFLNDEAWYKKVGKPYRMNLLLAGPPGCAKTSCVKAVANHTGRHVILLDTSKFQNASQMCATIMQFPKNNGIKYNKCIFVLEELDCWAAATGVRTASDVDSDADSDSESDSEFMKESVGSVGSAKSRKKAMSAKSAMSMMMPKPKNSFSDLGVLLNMLDGVQEMHGAMIMVTTNHPEKFDPALTRPGRLDTFTFERLGVREIAQFWNLYFGVDPPEDAPTSATVAELTAYMACYKNAK